MHLITMVMRCSSACLWSQLPRLRAVGFQCSGDCHILIDDGRPLACRSSLCPGRERVRQDTEPRLRHLGYGDFRQVS